ncbi:hypothetical protein BVRB_039490, partial [Beta vulgaris subsp. vulgaris]
YFVSLVESGRMQQLLMADQYLSAIVSMCARPALLLSYQLRVHIYLLHLQSGDTTTAREFLQNIAVNTIRFHDSLFGTDSNSAIQGLSSTTTKDAVTLVPLHFEMLKELTRRTAAAIVEPDDDYIK